MQVTEDYYKCCMRTSRSGTDSDFPQTCPEHGGEYLHTRKFWDPCYAFNALADPEKKVVGWFTEQLHEELKSMGINVEENDLKTKVRESIAVMIHRSKEKK